MSALASAMQLMGKTIRPQGSSPPDELIAAVLNAGSVRRSRLKMHDDFVIHVSDLMKTSSSDMFCPREQALFYFNDYDQVATPLSAGFELLFETGNTIHDHVRNKWMERSEHGNTAWGGWQCKCGHVKLVGLKPVHSRSTYCSRCKCHAHIYVEYDLYARKYRLVGHPDFIVKWGDTFYIYEIKTIDRVDIDFARLDAPLGDHTLQASFYYWLLVSEGKKVSPIIRYLYVDRSTWSLFGFGGKKTYKEFKHRASDISRLQPLLDKATGLIEAIEARHLPDKVCKSASCTRAKKCRMAVSCFLRRSDKIYVPENSPKAETSPSNSGDKPVKKVRRRP